jgi:hypothetical protein
MKTTRANKGSCLIWGLVFILVVYIVGSIMITQHHNFMDKKIAKKILATLNQIQKAEKEYKAKTGKYTTNFKNIGINNFPKCRANKNILTMEEDGLLYDLENINGVLNIGVFRKETERRYSQIISVSSKEKRCLYELGDKRQKKFCMAIGCKETKLYSTSCTF